MLATARVVLGGSREGLFCKHCWVASQICQSQEGVPAGRPQASNRGRKEGTEGGKKAGGKEESSDGGGREGRREGSEGGREEASGDSCLNSQVMIPAGWTTGAVSRVGAAVFNRIEQQPCWLGWMRARSWAGSWRPLSCARS